MINNFTSYWKSPSFAGEKATSQLVVLLALLLFSLSSRNLYFDGPAAQKLTEYRVLLFSIACAWLFFTVGGWLIRRLLPGVSASRTTAVLILYSATEVIRSLGTLYFGTVFGIPEEPDWGFRIFGAAAAGGIIMALISSTLNDSHDFRESLSKIQYLQQDSLLLLESSQKNLERNKDQFAALIRRKIETAIRQNFPNQAGNKTLKKEVISRLYGLVDDVVRPLSRELSYSTQETIFPSEIRLKTRIPLRVIFENATEVQPFNPMWTSFLLLLVSAPLIFVHPNIAYVVEWLVSVLIVFIVLASAKKYLQPLMPRWNVALRVVAMTLVFMLSTMSLATVNLVQLSKGQLGSGTTIIFAVIFASLALWLIAIHAGVYSSREEILNNLVSITERIERRRVRLETQSWLEQKQLSLILHNEVQSSLVAIAMNLSSQSTKSDYLNQDNLSSIHSQIESLLKFEASEQQRVPLNDFVNSLNDNWGSIIVMKLQANKTVLSRVDKDEIANRVVREILSEFQLNSLKHGKASKTKATLSLSQPEVVTLTLTNNGQSASSNPTNFGLGTAFIEAVALSISFSQPGEPFRLTLQIPIE